MNKKELDKKIMDMAREDPEKFYKQTIDSLIQVQNEDKAAIYTLLGIIIAYMSGAKFDDASKDKQNAVVEAMLIDYDIENLGDLYNKLNERISIINNSKIYKQEPLGGVH